MTEEDQMTFSGICMLYCSAEDYIYRKVIKSEVDYDFITRAKDAALGLMHMCLKAIKSDRSHTVQKLIDKYYDFLKVNGERNPFTHNYTPNTTENKE